MKKIGTTLLLVLMTLLLSSCSNQSKQTDGTSFLDDCDIVATIEVVNGDSVIVCDYNKIRQRKNVPLDELVTDFTILKMDNENEEGLIGESLAGHIIGEKYIAVYCYGFIPVKLYDKQGKFIRDIGKFGQGPGEYTGVNNVYMDEKSDRIYVLSFDTDKVLVYDFEGNIFSPIPLVEKVGFGNAIIPDVGQERLIVTQSLGQGGEYLVWVQDFQGNIIQAVKQSDYFSEDSHFAESTVTQLQTPKIEYFRLGSRNTNEYLYHYSGEENRLIPKFCIKNMEAGAIFIYELPYHFVAQVATSTSPFKDDYFTPKMIIDKYTLKGCYFDGFVTPEGIVLDQYDILFNARYGYFGLVEFGSNIVNKIEKVDREKLSPESTKELKKLQQLIDETDPDDDCSLLLYGKFKQ